MRRLVLGALMVRSMASALPVMAQDQRAPSIMQRFEIISDTLAYGGRSFGNVGAYRHIQARAHLLIDPSHPDNAAIVDLDKAPHDAEGRVAYSTDVVLLVPADATRARRVLVTEVPNRGMRLVATLYQAGKAMPEFTPSVAPLDKAEGAGVGFFENRGYSLAWIGWQSGVRGIKAYFPPVLENGRAVTGKVHISTVFDKLDKVLTWALVYPSSSLDPTSLSVSVRANQRSPARPLPAESVSFIDAKTLRIDRPVDMDAGAIYELTYTATDADVAGLGFAATRDVVAFLRSGKPDAEGQANPLSSLKDAHCTFGEVSRCKATAEDTVDFAIGLGGSQSGRYLRDMLYQGFNADGQGGKVFEGIMPFIAGSRRTFANRRWAEPGRFSRQHEERLVYGDQFPFTYASTTDSVTGKRDGLMETCRADNSCPRIMQIDTSAEFWMAGASLVGTDSGGKHDIAFPPEVRAYFIASGTHQTNNGSPVAVFPGNPLASGPLLRSLLVDLDDWIAKGIAPPKSRWPRIGDRNLGTPDTRAGFGFPDLSSVGLPYAASVYRLNFVDYSTVPPVEDSNRAYHILVPRTDIDGNDVGGVRLPRIATPLGTHLGWNPRKPGFAQGQQAFLAGSYLPFAIDADERQQKHDPRLSLKERYADRHDYVVKASAAANALLDARLLLPDDVVEAGEVAGDAYDRAMEKLPN